MYASDAIWNHRRALAEIAPRLKLLMEVIDCPKMLNEDGWIQLYAMVRQFEPTLIIELGRKFGNSTSLFAEYANTSGSGTRVLSVDYGRHWERSVVPRLRKVVEPEWFAPLQALRENITKVDFKKHISEVDSVFLYYDAHGYELAHHVLGYILPLLGDRAHLVIIDDILDSRYIDRPDRDYDSASRPTYWAGDLYGHFPEIIAIYDFLCRNQIEIQTVAHDLRTALCADQSRWPEVARILEASYGLENPLSTSTFLYFTLADRVQPDAPLHFPDSVHGDHLISQLVMIPPRARKLVRILTRLHGKYER